jgi:HEAT repeat protein
VRVAAIEALSEVRDSRVIEPLVFALKDKDHYIRAMAASALGAIGDVSALPGLLAASNDPSWEVRKATVESLGRLKDPRSVDPLAERLKDSDHDVRLAAAEALGQVGDVRALDRLIVALVDEDSPVRQMAASALLRIDCRWEKSELAQKAVPDLKVALKHREYWVRQSASDVLAKISNLRAAESTPTGFSNAAHYRHQAAVEALLRALTDVDRDFRQAAAEALARLKDPRTVDPLVRSAQDEDLWVRRAASNALELIGWTAADDPAAVPDPAPSNSTEEDMWGSAA